MQIGHPPAAGRLRADFREAVALFRANLLRLAAFQACQQAISLIHPEALEGRAWLPALVYGALFLTATTEAASLIQLRAWRRGESHELARILRLALLRAPDLLWAWLVSVCGWIWGFALAFVPGFYVLGRLAFAIPFSTLDGSAEIAGRAPVRSSLRLTRPMAWRLGLVQAPVLALSVGSLWLFRTSGGSAAASLGWGVAEFLLNFFVGGLWAAFLIVVSEQALERERASAENGALLSRELAAVHARGVTYSWVRLILGSWLLIGLILIPIGIVYGVLRHAGIGAR